MKQNLKIITLIILIMAGIALAGTGCISGYMYMTTRDLIRSASPDCPNADAVLVLGARIYPGGRLSAVLYDRMTTALELYRSGKVRKFLLSGDHGSRYYDEVNSMRRFLLERDVPPRDIFLDHAGFDTYDSLYRARNVFGAESVIICTQRFHLYRALYIARSLGIDAVGVEADRRSYESVVRNQTREVLARVKAVCDVILSSSPVYSGPVIPLSGDGTVTWDRDRPQK